MPPTNKNGVKTGPRNLTCQPLLCQNVKTQVWKGDQSWCERKSPKTPPPHHLKVRTIRPKSRSRTQSNQSKMRATCDSNELSSSKVAYNEDKTGVESLADLEEASNRAFAMDGATTTCLTCTDKPLRISSKNERKRLEHPLKRWISTTKFVWGLLWKMFKEKRTGPLTEYEPIIYNKSFELCRLWRKWAPWKWARWGVCGRVHTFWLHSQKNLRSFSSRKNDNRGG